MTDAALLAVNGLSVSLANRRILDRVSLQIAPGETHGVVGASGSGKSMLARAIMRLLPRGAAMDGDMRLAGRDLLKLDEREMCAIRGRDIGLVFQEPMSALNPLQSIGRQIGEGFRIHRGATQSEADAEAQRLMERVGLSAAGITADRYPHELSGGQRQRAVIAMAIALSPALLIADEPTTALDVMAQAEIVRLLRDLTCQSGMGLIFITHDLALASGIVDRISIMDGGRIIETGACARTLRAPQRAETRALVEASAFADRRRQAAFGPQLLAIRNARRVYCPLSAGARPRIAVDDVSLSIRAGETVALVGESGCGKSTLARMLLGLEPFDGGALLLDGSPINFDDASSMKGLRRAVQIVFQDPFGSFNPRQRIGRIVSEPMHLLKPRPDRRACEAAAAKMLARVGLDPGGVGRFPHEFSGGERQRIAIARALIINPKIIVLDEAISALDAATRSRILDLLAEIGRDSGVSYLFITHDIAAAQAFADRILVMRAGRIVDEQTSESLGSSPALDPYTQALVSAAPVFLPGARRVEGPVWSADD